MFSQTKKIPLRRKVKTIYFDSNRYNSSSIKQLFKKLPFQNFGLRSLSIYSNKEEDESIMQILITNTTHQEALQNIITIFKTKWPLIQLIALIMNTVIKNKHIYKRISKTLTYVFRRHWPRYFCSIFHGCMGI